MSIHTISLVGGEDKETATLTCEGNGIDRTCQITFRYRDRVIVERAENYFRALCQVRLQLEPEGLVPFCYGASLDIYPTGMCSDMAAGLVAYRVIPGKGRLGSGETVRIFDSGPDIIPSTVAKQRMYCRGY